ncbi:MAG: hypothetical protein ACI8TQ_001093 [Planctomycetota bacterium]|jgi:hypothetical protein
MSVLGKAAKSPQSAVAEFSKFILEAGPGGPTSTMHKAYKDLLHAYKVDAFRTEHRKKDVEELTGECMEICDEVLKAKYQYHFHKLPDADRAEIINMINNYTREAILPPVVERLVARQVQLEKRFELMEDMTAKMLELLSTTPLATNS